MRYGSWFRLLDFPQPPILRDDCSISPFVRPQELSNCHVTSESADVLFADGNILKSQSVISCKSLLTDTFGQPPSLPVKAPLSTRFYAKARRYDTIGFLFSRIWICQDVPMISTKAIWFLGSIHISAAKNTIFPRFLAIFPRFLFPLTTLGFAQGASPELDAVAVHQGLQGLLAARRLQEAQEWQQRLQQLGLRQLELLGKKMRPQSRRMGNGGRVGDGFFLAAAWVIVRIH